MQRWQPRRATKLEILQFIESKRIIFIFDLVERFGYTYYTAVNRLSLRHKLSESRQSLNRKENREMAETYPYPVEGCDHAPFKTVQALQSHIRGSHPGGWGRKAQPRKSPSSRRTLPLLNWLRVSIWT